jgi:outer membrane protein OmpA-like peptidoglycan-associated protein
MMTTGATIPTPPMVVVVTPPPPPPAPAPPPPETTRIAPSITVTRDIMDECKLTVQAIDNAPKFEFDQAELLPGDFDALKEIAECFSTGSMKGLPMVLVGRADPRGTVSYNETLGMKRASNVTTFLQSQGVYQSQMQPTSRGKLDATGYDEATWAVDRRVDILVGPH